MELFNENIIPTRTLGEIVSLDNVVANQSIVNGSFNGGTITIGSKENVFKVDRNGIYLGASSFSVAPFRVDMQGNLVASSATIAGDIVSDNYIVGVSGYKLEYSTGIGYFNNIVITGGTIGGQSVSNIANVSNSTALTAPAELSVTETAITIANDGTVSANITLSWTEETDPRFDHYQIRYKKSSFTYYQYINSNSNIITIDGLTPNTSYDFAVSSINKYGIPSTYSSTVTHTTATSTTAPATVNGVSATGGIQYVIIEWTSNSEKDLSSYNVYRNTVNNPETATLIGNCKTNYFVDGGRTGGTEYFYWVKAVNTSGLVSTDFSTVVSATPRNVAGSDTVISQRGWTQTCIFSSTSATQVNWGAGKFIASDGTTYNILAGNTGVMNARTYIFLDIDVSTTQYQITTTAGDAVGNNRVLIGSAINGTVEATFTIFSGDGAIKISKEGLEDGSIDLSKFSNGLTPIEVLDALPAENNFDGRTVFLTTDKKLHRYNTTEGKFTTAVPTTDLTGTIVETQIADNSISTGKIKANAITANEIATGAITANEIATGAITTNEIAVGTIEAGNIATGTITGDKIAAQTIETGNIKAGAITANEIAVGTITGNKIAAGTIEAGNIAAGTITGNEIAANTIEAGNIKAGTITTVELNFTPVKDTNVIASINASEEGIDISASKIATISAEKILIDGTTYLSNWRKSGDLTKIDGGSISTGSVTTAQLNFTPVIDGTIIASINASEEGIKISGEHIEISGSTSFSSGYDPTSKVDKLGGSYATASSGARVLIFPDTNTGLQIIDNGGADVFKAIIGGDNVGDVIIGNYTGGQGIFYDKSEAKTIFKGSMIAGDITGVAITGGTIDIPSSGWIKGGQTNYNIGNGFFLGSHADVYKFSLGNFTRSILDSYSIDNRDTGYSIYAGSTYCRGQSFTNTNEVIVRDCSFFLKRTGIPTGKITASIYAHTGTYGTSSKPDTTPLTTSEGIDVSTISTSSYEMISFSFKKSITLRAGHYYILAVSFNGGDANNKIWVGADGSSPTHSGNACYSSNGTDWTATTSYDLCFFVAGATSDKFLIWDGDNFKIKWAGAGGSSRIMEATVDGLDVPDLFPSGDWSIGGEGVNMLNGDWRVGENLRAGTAGLQNLGDSTLYFNDVSYKTLTDRGCLGWCDDGVELQDGRIVSDTEALCNIQKHPTKKTIYGIPMLNYKTLPKIVYKKAELNGEFLPRDENDEPYWIDEKDNNKKKIAADGAELTSLISIMIGSIKELDNRLKKIEKKINKSQIDL